MQGTIIISIIAALALIAFLIYFLAKRGSERPPNYKTLFILGIVYLPLGISTDNVGLLALGIVFFLVGLKHKKEWEKS